MPPRARSTDNLEHSSCSTHELERNRSRWTMQVWETESGKVKEPASTYDDPKTGFDAVRRSLADESC